MNAGASYTLKLGSRGLTLVADVFNVFNTQTVLDYDSFSELAVQRAESGLRAGRRLRRDCRTAIRHAAADSDRRSLFSVGIQQRRHSLFPRRHAVSGECRVTRGHATCC